MPHQCISFLQIASKCGKPASITGTIWEAVRLLLNSIDIPPTNESTSEEQVPLMEGETIRYHMV